MNYVVLTTFEDGNKFALSEGVIAKFWMELFSFKKIPHLQFIAEISAEEAKILLLQNDENNSSSSSSESDKKLIVSTPSLIKFTEDSAGKLNALNALSNEFVNFAPHQFFSRQPVLDCTKFVAKLLKKGGLDLYLTDKLPEGHISVSHFMQIAAEVKQNILAAQYQPRKIKDPKLKISNTAATC